MRLCDGFYWPISFATSRSRFSRDASQCRASCGEEAQLFYVPVTGEPADMVDLTGRAYSALPSAFKYRKALVEGCKCKPEPWSLTEAARHKTYADAAEEEERRKRLAAAPGRPGASPASDQTAPPADDDKPSPHADPPPSPWGAPVPPPSSKRLSRTDDASATAKRGAPSRAPVAHAAKPSWPGAGTGLGGKGLVWPGDAR